MIQWAIGFLLGSGGEIGPFYKEIMGTVSKVLGDLKGQFPGDAGQGYEIVGFVWWHGWNDFCNPKTAVPEYEKNLTNLINDVRRDLKTPKLPVLVGEFTGPWGADCIEPAVLAIRKAQKEVAAKPEFAGNVVFVETHDFVRTAAQSPTGEGIMSLRIGRLPFCWGTPLARRCRNWFQGSGVECNGRGVGWRGFSARGGSCPPREVVLGSLK